MVISRGKSRYLSISTQTNANLELMIKSRIDLTCSCLSCFSLCVVINKCIVFYHVLNWLVLDIEAGIYRSNIATRQMFVDSHEHTNHTRVPRTTQSIQHQSINCAGALIHCISSDFVHHAPAQTDWRSLWFMNTAHWFIDANSGSSIQLYSDIDILLIIRILSQR